MNSDDVMQYSAAMAYYTIFSIAPLMLLLVSIAAMVFGPEAAQGKVTGQIDQFLGTEAASNIQEVLKNSHREHRGALGTIVGAIILLVGASGVFNQMEVALNRIWIARDVTSKISFWQNIKDRLATFVIVIGICFLLITTLVVSSVLTFIASKITSGFLTPFLASFGNVLITFTGITMLFAVVYRYLPDTKLDWKDVWPGALFAAGLFSISKFLIGYYIGKSNMSSSFGAAGFLIVILLWSYFTSVILFLGAEFIKVYRFHGRHINDPDPVAMGPQSELVSGL